MTSYRLRVYGEPAPQGSKRAFVHNGRAVLVESSSVRVKEWRKLVAYAFSVVDEPIEGAVTLEVEFIMPRPKYMSGLTLPHIKRPDVDKLLRSTADALTGLAYKDDSQVSVVKATKRYAELDEQPGATITVSGAA